MANHGVDFRGRWWINNIHHLGFFFMCSGNVRRSVTGVTLPRKRERSDNPVHWKERSECMSLQLTKQTRLAALILGCAILRTAESLIPLYVRYTLDRLAADRCKGRVDHLV